MYLSELKIRNFRQYGQDDSELEIAFQPGVTALVGRNDSGKSAIIDAIRYALSTRDQEFIRVQPEDFHIDAAGRQATEISTSCKLIDLTDSEKGVFLEYLSYQDDSACLYVHWTARNRGLAPGTRRWTDVSVSSGVEGTGPSFEMSARELLAAAYLRPLRDAEREMSPGRGSRLSQILSTFPKIADGVEFNANDIPRNSGEVRKLGLVGLADYMHYNVKKHSGITNAQDEINKQYLSSLSLRGDDLRGRIDFYEASTDSAKLRQVLERLELGLLNAETEDPLGRFGLGSNNLLFMACELLLLSEDLDGIPLLLIEEPEAHLHPQRQLRLMDFLQQAADRHREGKGRSIQVILSTHSPNLASRIPLASLVLLEGGRAFPLAKEQTNLEGRDYRFLERFLDVTKANLFFAHGVLIVEGVSEAILLPVLAKLIGKDLNEHGVSIVNVGSRGLRRFSRIYQRRNENAPTIGIPVACLADKDVLPDCAPQILGLVEGDEDMKWTDGRRRWKAERDFGADGEQRKKCLEEWCEELKAWDGQSVQTFVSDHWTLEYDLACRGLAEQVFVAATLAMNDDSLNDKKQNYDEVVEGAKTKFIKLREENNCDEARICSNIYRIFYKGNASKAISAQYLSELLLNQFKECEDVGASLKSLLPNYLVDAIDYATSQTTRQVE